MNRQIKLIAWSCNIPMLHIDRHVFVFTAYQGILELGGYAEETSFI